MNNELAKLRQRIAELEKSETRCRCAEEALRKEMDKAQKYLDVAKVVMVAIDADQKVTLINKKGCEILGYNEREIIGKNWFDTCIPEKTRDQVKAVFAKLMAGEIEPVEFFENPILRKSGEERIIAWHNTILMDETGKITGTLSSGEDITERKKAENEQTKAKELSDALNNINTAINSTLDFDEIMQRVVVESAKVLGAETAAIGLREGEYWVLRYIYRFPTEYIGTKLADEEVPHLALAARTRKTIAINDAYHDDRVKLDVIERYGICSVLIVPMMVKDEMIGALAFNYHSRPVAFTEVEIDFSTKLAASVSLALENAHLYAERKHAEEALKNYAAKLEEANELKDLFTDIIRHDLLNPLGVIQTMAELQLDKTGNIEARKSLLMIKRNADKLIEMIKSASTYARLESAEKLERFKLDLNEIFRMVVNNLKPMLEEKNMKLDYLAKDKCFAMVNPMIEDAFSNLLSNAIKYSPAGRKIEVNIIDEKEHYRIYVKDWGYGIKDEDKAKLFTRFQRVDKKGVKGTGLGLAIVKRIVELQDGKVWIEDNPEGGSVFYLEIPKYL